MTKQLRAYLAGFLDGEGTFTISKAYRGTRFDYFVVIQCGMADCEENWKVLSILKRSFGGYLRKYKTRKNKQRDLLFWRITTQKAKICAKTLLPYLVIKKEQAKLVISLASLQGRHNLKRGRNYRLSEEEITKRNNLVVQIRHLNLRGMAAKYRQYWAAAETERSDTQNG